MRHLKNKQLYTKRNSSKVLVLFIEVKLNFITNGCSGLIHVCQEQMLEYDYLTLTHTVFVVVVSTNLI